MTRAIIAVARAGASQAIDLRDTLDAPREEAAWAGAYAWIKSLRHARVDGQPLRRRFTYRGDSLWWFTEIYLHKQQVVHRIFRTLAALDALVERERPDSIGVADGDRLLRLLVPRFAASRGIRCTTVSPRASSLSRIAAMDARGAWLHASALASRLRRRARSTPPRSVTILAFVHRAFWQAREDGTSAEQYIGPVLSSLEEQLPANALGYVSVGPSANFRARRWWHPLAGGTDPEPHAAVEAFSNLATLRPSRRLWRARHGLRRALWRSHDLREAAVIGGCDCWPILREELAGVALLQWPWSARAMDEAGAALDACRPAAALTYAEAGGWGRALVLECRRRGIPVAGLQHGFIHRHWLNYRHEPDEMAPDPGNPSDEGFPRPALTLLYDDYAARHLTEAGSFPAEALQVTGSARLDAIVRASRGLTSGHLARARAGAGAAPAEALVLVATKWSEARLVLPGVLAAASRIPNIRIAIKTHPGETPAAYDAVRSIPGLTILPASVPLGPLLAASRAVLTVNSTVALDAAVIGVPALVVGLPNNLSPFVDAGMMAGVPAGDDQGAARLLERILYDEEFRRQLDEARRGVLAAYRMESDGQAASRAAGAILDLARMGNGRW
jgi:hypothetical protein